MGTKEGNGPVRRIRRSFSLKLIIVFLSVVLVIGGIGGIIYAQTGDALRESTEENMNRSTVLQANTVGEWVDRTADKTAHLARSSAVESGDERRIGRFLADERETAPDSVAAIHYYDTSAHEVLASSDDAAGTSYEAVAEGDYGFAVDDGDRATLSHPYDDPATGEPAVAFLSGVPDRADRAIVTVVDLEAQTAHLERPSTAEGSFTHVVNSRGTVVMSHNGEINTQNMGPEGEFVVESMAVDRGSDGEIGFEEMPMHGGTMAMGFAPVPGTDWVIMTHIPAESAYALQDDITRSVAALVVLSVVGIGAIGIVIGRNTTRSLRELVDHANRIQDGNLETEVESERVDEIGRLYDAFDDMRRSLREQIRAVKRAREETQETNRHLEAKADEYREVMRACAEGDLTRRMDPESENDAMEAIAVEFNEMVSELERTAEALSNFADEVAASSEHVTASTEEVQSASTQVAASIQEISDGADRQHERLQSVTDEMEGLSTTTEQIAASSNEVADLAASTARTGRDGRDAAEEAIAGLNEVESESQQAVEAFEALEAEVERIDELAEFISEVAEQTNMLALNANIEASRSTTGDDDGFSVVANEVKDLAAETKDAAETIEERIESIKSQTDHAAEEVGTTSEQIVEHRDTIERTVEALEEIAAYAERTNDGVQEISASTEQQAAATQEVVAMVDEAATISEETAAEAESAAAAGEEQTSSLTEVTEAIDDLSAQAVELSTRLDQFETDAGLESPSVDVGDGAADAESLAYDERRSGADSSDPDAGRADRTASDEAFTFVDADDVSSADDSSE